MYEFGPSLWIHDVLGERNHFLAEVLIYGTIGPVLSFFLLDLLSRWLEERETSDLQSRVLAQVNEHVNRSRSLSDDAIQTLFAASLLLMHLKENLPADYPEAAASLDGVERAIDQNIQQLRSHLLNTPPGSGNLLAVTPPPVMKPPEIMTVPQRHDLQASD